MEYGILYGDYERIKCLKGLNLEIAIKIRRMIMGKTYEYCYEEAIGISKLKDALSTAGIIILKETSIQHGTKFIFQNGAAIITVVAQSRYILNENFTRHIQSAQGKKLGYFVGI